jgi:hypothetical protein
MKVFVQADGRVSRTAVDGRRESSNRIGQCRYKAEVDAFGVARSPPEKRWIYSLQTIGSPHRKRAAFSGAVKCRARGEYQPLVAAILPVVCTQELLVADVVVLGNLNGKHVMSDVIGYRIDRSTHLILLRLHPEPNHHVFASNCSGRGPY